MAIPSGYTPLAKIGLAYKGTYVSGTNYKQLDAVYYLGSTYLALIDNPAGSPNNDGVNWRYLAQGAGEDISDSAVTFTQATTRANINSGEQNKTIMGKIKKWFADLTAAAFSQMISSYTDLMANTVSGYLPDALAVKEGFNEINSNLSKAKIKISINNDNATVVSTNCIFRTDNVLYVDVYVQVTTEVPSLGDFVMFADEEGNPINMTHRVDVALVGIASTINQPCVRLLCCEENSHMFIANGLSIPDGIYKLTTTIMV